MYGDGIFALNNIRIKGNKLMIDCVDNAEVESTRTVFMDAKVAQKLVDEIWHEATGYQNSLRARVT